QRMRKIDIVLDREFFRWIDAERLFAIFENELFGDTNILPPAFLFNKTGVGDGFCVRKRASVQNGNLEVVELDICIIDADSVQRRQKMFHRRDPDAAAHKGCRISNPCDRTDISPKLKIVEIDTPEDDACSSWSGKDAKGGILACMQSNTAELDRTRNRLLVHRFPPMQFHGRIAPSVPLTTYKPNMTGVRVHLCTIVAGIA